MHLTASGYRNIAQGGDPLICRCILEMDLPRPKYAKLDPVFAKKGSSVYGEARIFFRVISVIFGALAGPWTVLQLCGGQL